MEHRFDHRRPVVCQVGLKYRNQYVLSCRVRAVGRGGALEPDDGGRHVEGLVVHHTSQGVGLMFLDEQAATLLLLIDAQGVQSL